MVDRGNGDDSKMTVPPEATTKNTVNNALSCVCPREVEEEDTASDILEPLPILHLVDRLEEEADDDAVTGGTNNSSYVLYNRIN